VEAVLTWLAQRPLPPQPIATAPAAARATQAESTVASERQSARGAHRSTYSAFGNGGALAFFRGSGSGGGYGGRYDDLQHSGKNNNDEDSSSSRMLTVAATPFRMVVGAPKLVVLTVWAVVAAVFLSLTRVLALLRAAELLRFSSAEQPRPRTTNGGFAAVFNDIEGGGGSGGGDSSDTSTSTSTSDGRFIDAETSSSSSDASGGQHAEGSSPLVERGQMLLLLLVGWREVYFCIFCM